MINPLIEVVCFSPVSALNAEAGGANRIELCENAAVGGTTPSSGAIRFALKRLSIPMNVMIRPRGGDFFYEEDYFEIMKEDILFCKKMGVSGLVLGVLTQDGKVDMERNRRLVDMAAPLPVTFHRAFDMTENLFETLENCIECGFHTILTSGGQPSAEKGIRVLSDLVSKAGNRIQIMVGGGVRKNNIELLIRETGASAFHTSARIFVKSKMSYWNPSVSIGLPDSDEYQYLSTDSAEIRAFMEEIRRNSTL